MFLNNLLDNFTYLCSLYPRRWRKSTFSYTKMCRLFWSK